MARAINLRMLPLPARLHQDFFKDLVAAADKAEQFAHDLDSLIDGKDDELADLLEPVRDFLLQLAGRPVPAKDAGEGS